MLQSVMKILVAVAVFQAADAGKLSLDDRITLTPRDASVGIQPLAEEVARHGSLSLPVRDLVERMITQSDSMATDVLVDRLGGTGAVQAMIANSGVTGVRIDRTERQLQTEPYGLSAGMIWRGMADYEKRLSVRALADAPSAASDVRDTATPRGLAMFLAKAVDGSNLSPASAREFLRMMASTRTFPDRLKAAAPDGWCVAHKTGTSRTLNDVTKTTNDVGYMIAPDGRRVIAVAMLADSRAPARERAAAIASVGEVAIAYSRATPSIPAGPALTVDSCQKNQSN